jgi:hypothetical protein
MQRGLLRCGARLPHQGQRILCRSASFRGGRRHDQILLTLASCAQGRPITAQVLGAVVPVTIIGINAAGSCAHACSYAGALALLGIVAYLLRLVLGRGWAGGRCGGPNDDALLPPGGGRVPPDGRLEIPCIVMDEPDSAIYTRLSSARRNLESQPQRGRVRIFTREAVVDNSIRQPGRACLPAKGLLAREIDSLRTVLVLRCLGAV